MCLYMVIIQHIANQVVYFEKCCSYKYRFMSTAPYCLNVQWASKMTWLATYLQVIVCNYIPLLMPLRYVSSFWMVTTLIDKLPSTAKYKVQNHTRMHMVTTKANLRIWLGLSQYNNNNEYIVATLFTFFLYVLFVIVICQKYDYIP